MRSISRPRNGARASPTTGVARITPFAQPEGAQGVLIDCGGRTGRNFAPERADEGANVFRAAVDHVRALQAQGKRVIVAGWSEGSRERLSHVLEGFRHRRSVARLVLARGAEARQIERWRSPSSASSKVSRRTDLAVIGEQDILGDRLIHAPQEGAPRARFSLRSLRALGRRSRRPCRSRHRPFRRAEGDRGGGRAA